MAPARTLALVLASGVLALALLPSAQLRADDLPAPPVEAPPAPPAPPAAKGGPTEAERGEIQALVDSLREEAARIRGLAWKQRVPSDLITRTQMRADFLESLEEEVFDPFD